jgi:signal transduction histidine kinase
MTELAQIIAAWPVVLSMAAAVAMQNLRAGRRRSALNEALHELRRPLQAVALAAGPRLGDSGVSAEDPIELAAAALERLDREINGGPLAPALGPVDATALARSAVARWQARVRMAEGSLELRWSAGGTLVSGDRSALAQALDNLIVNAIEHGGPTIVVAGRLREGRLRIAVVDSGRRAWRAARGPPPPPPPRRGLALNIRDATRESPVGLTLLRTSCEVRYLVSSGRSRVTYK